MSYPCITCGIETSLGHVCINELLLEVSTHNQNELEIKNLKSKVRELTLDVEGYKTIAASWRRQYNMMYDENVILHEMINNVGSQ